MTTTATTQLRRSAPQRIRRNLTAVLAGGVLIASTALVVNRILDDEPLRVAAQPTVPSARSLDPAVTAPNMRLVIDEPSTEACGLGYAEACQSAHVWVSASAPLVLDPVALDACNGGYIEACTAAVGK